MNWKDQLRDASFRGKPFFVKAHKRTGGRRLAVNEFPKRDKPYNEDLGRKARVFTLEGYVLGTDYMAARDALLEALEAGGPGELIHPYFGSRTVDVQEFNLSETTAKGGMATFSITFCEGGESAEPTEKADTSWAVSKSADAVTETSVVEFSETFDTKGPEWVRIEALERIGSALDAAQATMDQTALPVNLVSQVSNEVASLKGDASTLLATPGSLASRLVGVITSLLTVGLTDPLAVIRSLFSYSNPAPASSPLSTMGAKAETNAEAVAALVRRVALAEGARNVSAMAFETYEDGLATRDLLADGLEDEAAVATDPVYLSLTDLRVAVVKDFAGRSSLPRLTSYQPAETVPALVVAHSIYGDATRSDEICTRNRVRHPGAVPGGRALEVLTNE
jgi:prophage DNA circulation protein